MKLRKRLFSALLIAVLFMAYMPAVSFALGDNIASGTCGTCDWVIDADGTLTISEGELDEWRDDYNWLPPWEDYKAQIKTVKTTGKVKLKTGNFMFQGCNNLTSLDTSNFDTSGVEMMNYMFSECSKLKSLDVRGFDTSNVTAMSFVFAGCSGLTSLDVSSFDTSKVEEMRGMFNSCSGLTTLNLYNFDISKVEDMEGMLYECENLASLEVGAGWKYNSISSDDHYTDFPVFPVNMKNSISEEVFTAGNYIPEGAAKYVATAESVCYKLAFDGNGGTGADVRSIEAGTACGKLPTSTRRGYDFIGWYTDKDRGSKVSAKTVIKKDTTLYAHWKAHKYSIKFVKNGGEGTMKTMKDLAFGTRYSLKANSFKRSGYIFKGWGTSKNGPVKYNNKASFVNITDKDGKTVKLYAIWQKKTATTSYTISYNANGGKGTMEPDKNRKTGKTYKLKENSFTREGYTFIGWSTKKNGKVEYGDNAPVRNLSTTNGATVKLYAIWEESENTEKVNEAQKAVPKVYGCVISGCNDRYQGHNLNGATDVYYKLCDNKISGYKTEVQNIKLVGVGQPAPYKHQIDEFINEAFESTTNNDISFVYYAGHGCGGGSNGTGVGICLMDDNWGGYYSYSDFLNLLDRSIKGKIVFIVDACYSGGFVKEVKNSPVKDRICILAASADDELSTGTLKAYMDVEGSWVVVEQSVLHGTHYIDEKLHKDSSYQCFTYAMMEGLKWRGSGNYPADVNKDKVVTCEELYAYINSNISKASTQSPKCYLGKLKNQSIFG